MRGEEVRVKQYQNIEFNCGRALIIIIINIDKLFIQLGRPSGQPVREAP